MATPSQRTQPSVPEETATSQSLVRLARAMGAQAAHALWKAGEQPATASANDQAAPDGPAER